MPKKNSQPNYKVGSKVILHSAGAGRVWPDEPHIVVRVTKKGVIYVDGLENVGFTQCGTQAEPGAFHFRFSIEPAPERSTKRGRGK